MATSSGRTSAKSGHDPQLERLHGQGRVARIERERRGVLGGILGVGACAHGQQGLDLEQLHGRIVAMLFGRIERGVDELFEAAALAQGFQAADGPSSPRVTSGCDVDWCSKTGSSDPLACAVSASAGAIFSGEAAFWSSIPPALPHPITADSPAVSSAATSQREKQIAASPSGNGQQFHFDPSRGSARGASVASLPRRVDFRRFGRREQRHRRRKGDPGLAAPAGLAGERTVWNTAEWLALQMSPP